MTLFNLNICLFLATLTVSSAILQYSQPQIAGNVSLSLNTSGSPFNDSVPSSNPTLKESVLKCDRTTYGGDLRMDSCYDAYYNIFPDDTEHSYGDRSRGRYDRNLPRRYISRKSEF